MLQRGLPHLYGRKWYRWAKAFYKSQNKINICCGGNQSTKSSTQIRKCIDWATDKKKWPTLWPNHTPRIFWYLYPSFEVATVEYENKWVPEFLPRDEFKNDPIYGWHVDYDGGYISAIRFNSGVTVYFKAYSQKGAVLQTATVSAIFCDEELPEILYGELMFRLAATDGYFNMVLTNTLNQQFWYRVIEGKGDNELLPEAFKLNVSLYDCLLYEDGSPGAWTEVRVKEMEKRCATESEKLRRIHGRYVADESSLLYPIFDPTKHYIKPVDIPKDWRIYGGVDVGSGGTASSGGFSKAHPAAIVFIAVRPDNRLGYIFRGWRGDSVVTTAADILEKYRHLRGQLNVTMQVYDHSSKDFGIIAQRMGEPFLKADKARSSGEDTLSTLFQSGMLFVFDDDEELRKLGTEFMMLKRGADKAKAKDDFIDCTRYTCMAIPWDFTFLEELHSVAIGQPAVPRGPETPQQYEARLMDERRAKMIDSTDYEAQQFEEMGEIGEEFKFWNERYGN